jgi:hypothetical protein
MSIKFVQIKALGFKLARSGGLNTGERLQGIDGPLVISICNGYFQTVSFGFYWINR